MVCSHLSVGPTRNIQHGKRRGMRKRGDGGERRRRSRSESGREVEEEEEEGEEGG